MLFKTPLVDVGRLKVTVSLAANCPPEVVPSEKFCHCSTVLFEAEPGTVIVSALVPVTTAVAEPAVTIKLVAVTLGTVASAS